MVRLNANAAFKRFAYGRRSRVGQAYGWWVIFLVTCITLALFGLFVTGIDPQLTLPYTTASINYKTLNQTTPSIFRYTNMTQFTSTGSGILLAGSGTIPTIFTTGSSSSSAPLPRISVGWWRYTGAGGLGGIQTVSVDAIYVHDDQSKNILGWINYDSMLHQPPQTPILLPIPLGGVYPVPTTGGILNGIYATAGTLLTQNQTLFSFWNSAKGASVVSWSDSRQTFYMALTPETGNTMAESWTNGNVTVSWGDQMNLTNSGISAFTIIAQLLTFQTPNLGLPAGIAGDFITSLIAIPLWFAIIFVAYKLICGIIPFISGGE